jgi:polysaccharide biosynthesis protein PslH
MRILNITNQIPYPVTSGAPVRSYNLLRRFSKDHEVYLAAFLETKEQSKGVAHLLKFCREVVTVRGERLRELPVFWKFLKYPFQRGPAELKLSFSEELAIEIQNLAARMDFDVVLIEHGCMGLYLEALPPTLRKRTVWILHDIDFDKFKRISRIERRVDRKMRAWIHSMMMRRWQPYFAELFGLCVTMSEADRRLLTSVNHRLRVEVSPNGVDTHRYRPIPEESETPAMLFIGNMGYQPNVDAAIYFCKEVLPLIRARVADAELWLVGVNPRASVRRLAGDGVFVTEEVPDVVPYYTRSRVCVVPLRAGSGTRLKILEAMAIGRPVVSTSIGAEGLDVIDGKHVFIADDSREFAEKTIELLTNRALRTRLTKEAREYVVASFDWDVIARRLIEVFEGMAVKTREAEYSGEVSAARM